MNSTLEHLREITADMIMAAMYGAKLYTDQRTSPEIQEGLIGHFNHSPERYQVIGRIINYLYIQQPCIDPLINVYAHTLNSGKSDAGTWKEQWGEMTPELEEADRLAGKLLGEFSGIMTRVQGIRAAVMTFMTEVSEHGTTKQVKALYGQGVSQSVNSTLPSLVYMKSQYEALKDYWVVELLPYDEDHLNNSHYLSATQGIELRVGKYFDSEYINTPIGKITFDAPEVIPFRM